MGRTQLLDAQDRSKLSGPTFSLAAIFSTLLSVKLLRMALELAGDVAEVYRQGSEPLEARLQTGVLQEAEDQARAR